MRAMHQISGEGAVMKCVLILESPTEFAQHLRMLEMFKLATATHFTNPGLQEFSEAQFESMHLKNFIEGGATQCH